MQSGCENGPYQSNPRCEAWFFLFVFFRFKFTKLDRFLNRNDRTDTGHSRQFLPIDDVLRASPESPNVYGHLTGRGR